MTTILLIAPRTDLLMVDAEVQNIMDTDGLNVRLRMGEIRTVDVVRYIRESDADILWFATHGSKDGVMLSDGMLSPSMLAQLVRGRFAAVVLNTCESVQVAMMLQNETDAEIIATVIQVPDNEAFATGTLLADWLGRTGDLETAYNASRPGSNRTYLRLAGSKKK